MCFMDHFRVTGKPSIYHNRSRWSCCGPAAERGVVEAPAPWSDCPCGGRRRPKSAAPHPMALGLQRPSAPGGAVHRLHTRDSGTLRPPARPRSTWAASARGACGGQRRPPISGLRPAGLIDFVGGRHECSRTPAGAGAGHVET
ncbi:hypothetical protein NDU88_007943 [Pleurodeles waltl]|uniref:Uncharacterized protein n=1 Tax=Pleurodeles waltl TaxID=8319 RepID=A0AAV7QNI8_PLEWA|nr:hypothetical protein NDU88_007943 [Pleurodeles waltl]